MHTNLYIDGFNLYNRAVKNTAFKWLDLRRLAVALVPHDNIQRIAYVTALVRSRPNDPHQTQRQATDLGAPTVDLDVAAPSTPPSANWN